MRLEPANASGGQNFQGLCWYRRHFTPEESWQGRKVSVRVGGAMQVAELFLNGQKLLTHEGGYLPFVIDITDKMRPHLDNVLSVKLDHRNQPLIPPGTPQERLDFAYFGGLYRNVSVIVTDRIHVTDPLVSKTVAGGGVFVTFPEVSTEKATVSVKTEVENERARAAGVTVIQELCDAERRIVATASSSVSIPAGSSSTVNQAFAVSNPKLWHPEHPSLYNLHTRIVEAGRAVDELATRVGIRSLEIRKDALLINGKAWLATGFNHHQDYRYLGYAVPDSLQIRDVKKMREAGLTSFRSHYPHSDAFMDACDEFGVLAIVSTPGWQWFPKSVRRCCSNPAVCWAPCATSRRRTASAAAYGRASIAIAAITRFRSWEVCSITRACRSLCGMGLPASVRQGSGSRDSTTARWSSSPTS